MKLKHLIVLPMLAVCAAMLPPVPQVKSVRLSWEATKPVEIWAATNLAGPETVWRKIVESTNDSQAFLVQPQPRFYKLFAGKITRLHISSPGGPFNSSDLAWMYASPTGSLSPDGSYQSPFQYQQITNLYPGMDVALKSGTYTNLWVPSRVVVNDMEPPVIGNDGYPAAYTVDVYP